MKRALIVGINDYPNAQLHGCVNDANAISNVLSTNGDGSPNFEPKLMTSPGETITRATLRAAIEALFAGDPDIALLYFSGHGYIKSTGGYIVTTDFKKYDEGVSMDEILNLANQSKAKNKVVILDCCHSGAFGSPALTDKPAAHLSEGLSVLTASRDTESAIEINGTGVFTALVVSALQGGAADLGGHVTPGSIYAYVDQALGAWDQRPIFKTNVSRFTVLRSVPPPVPLDTLRKICTYFPAAQDKHALDPSYEFTNSNDYAPATVIEPTAKPENVAILKDLQKFVSAGLVVPDDEEHMYFAAMKSKSCRLTALGFHYWNLVKKGHL
jgi:hypothetical protein